MAWLISQKSDYVSTYGSVKAPVGCVKFYRTMTITICTPYLDETLNQNFLTCVDHSAKF